MHVVQVNYAYDPRLRDPEELLDRYDTLVGWSEAVLAGGAAAVTVAQHFWRDADLERRGVRYLFRRDRGPAQARAWTLPRRLHRDVHAAAPDVAHVNGLLFPAATWHLRRGLPLSRVLVVQDHGGFGPHGVRGPSLAWRACHAGVDAFLFSAGDQAREWREAGLLTPGRVVFEIPESSRTLVPLPREDARRRTRLDGDPAVLWVGRLNANKDPLTVLDAFTRALPFLPGAVLTLAFSEDDLLSAVRGVLDAEPTLRARVELRGRVPPSDMAALYSAADVFVLGSHREGSGYALLEAMACGAIPVVTDIPSFRSFTDGGAIGALWRPGDAAACASALVAVGTRPLAPQREATRRRFDEALSWGAVGRTAVRVYREALDRRRSSR
jgi:glycosyltransferase involved in cell wall biosynthesis